MTDVEALREAEVRKVEAAQRAIWPKVEAGDVRAAEVWDRLADRRARLLGLMPPEQVTETAVDSAIQRLTIALNEQRR